MVSILHGVSAEHCKSQMTVLLAIERAPLSSYTVMAHWSQCLKDRISEALLSKALLYKALLCLTKKSDRSQSMPLV